MGEGGIRVFTTRPDTLFGATYMVLAPEHQLVREITTPERRKDVEAYVEKVSRTIRNAVPGGNAAVKQKARRIEMAAQAMSVRTPASRRSAVGPRKFATRISPFMRSPTAQEW